METNKKESVLPSKNDVVEVFSAIDDIPSEALTNDTSKKDVLKTDVPKKKKKIGKIVLISTASFVAGGITGFLVGKFWSKIFKK